MIEEIPLEESHEKGIVEMSPTSLIVLISRNSLELVLNYDSQPYTCS